MLSPKDGEHYVDGTFGGGGYTRAILEAADCRVLGIDRDPDAIARGQALVAHFAGRLTLVQGEFSQLDALLERRAHQRRRARSRRLVVPVRRAGARLSPSAPTARSTCA